MITIKPIKHIQKPDKLSQKPPVYQPKLHETGKRYEVSETDTIRNRPSKNGNVGGNAEGNAVYIYIYIVLKKIKHYIARKT
jgi:hypothetical protein